MNENISQSVVRSGSQNVLNDYRSFTYNFTISALKRSAVTDSKSFLDSENTFTILKSGGNGTSGISSAGPATANQLVDQFNKLSPGRFDMFIDDVTIETLMAFEPRSNITLPTKIEFTVMEPYSINGFIEAIHVAAVAAGYDTYVGASFLLKVDFIGYADTDTIDTAAKSIPNSSRYFPFIFTGLEVTLTEKGTQYRCSAVPFNEKGFGEPNKIKKPISVSGDSIFEILNNLIDGVNKQVVASNNSAKSAENAATGRDKYFIEFKSLDATTNTLITDIKGDIPTAKLDGFFTSKTLFKMPDPGAPDAKADNYRDNKDKQPTKEQQADQPQIATYEPVNQKPGVQFAEGAAIHECISVMIRDSDYVRGILSKIATPGSNIIDPDTGFLNYFIVTMQVTHSDKTDYVTRMPYTNFTYIVSPYKIHYTQIPGYKATVLDASKIKSVSLRQYNYVYTGQNIDVLNFKLNFNTLFFEAIPAAMGNNSSPSARGAANKEPSNQAKISTTRPEILTADQNGVPPVRTISETTAVSGQLGGRGAQIQDSPYSVLAINMHDAIVNSKSSMLTGTLDILGDPFYLITGGVGNFEPEGHKTVIGMTKDGAAANNYGIVLIDINFRNPVDISSFKDGGMLYFDPIKVPFSGVYMVTQARSKFKDGVFKQELEIIRIPGQVLSSALPASDLSKVQTGVADPKENPTPITTLPTTTAGMMPNASNNATRAFDALLNNVDITTMPITFGSSVSTADLFGSKSASPLANLLANPNVK